MNFIEYLDKYNINPVFYFVAIFIAIFIIILFIGELIREGIIPFLKKVTTIEKGDFKITTNISIKNSSDVEKLADEVDNMISKEVERVSNIEKRIEEWSPMLYNIPNVYFKYIKKLINLNLKECSFEDCKNVIQDLQNSKEIKSIEGMLAEHELKKVRNTKKNQKPKSEIGKTFL